MQLQTQPISEVTVVGQDSAAVVDLAAKTLRRFVDLNVVTLLLQHAGCMHARNPASDH